MTTKQRATYASMETSTPEDWEIIKNYGSHRKEKVYNSMMTMLKQMELSDDGGPVNGPRALPAVGHPGIRGRRRRRDRLHRIVP